MDAPTITLQSGPVTLAKCSPFLAVVLSQRDDGDGAILAVGALALLACWPEGAAWPSRPKPPAWRPGEDVLKRGQEVFDSLHSVVPMGDRERRPLVARLVEAREKDGPDAGADILAALADLPIRDLPTMCYSARAWALSQIVREEEVAAAVGFSEPPQGG